MPMHYTLGEYEIGQMKALLIQLEEMYSEDVASQLRQLIEAALVNGYLTDKEIYKLLELLPMVIPQLQEEMPSIEQSECNDDWPECNAAVVSRKKRLHLQLQQHLSHLLFMQEAVHKVVLRRGQSKNMINGII